MLGVGGTEIGPPCAGGVQWHAIPQQHWPPEVQQEQLHLMGELLHGLARRQHVADWPGAFNRLAAPDTRLHVDTCGTNPIADMLKTSMGMSKRRVERLYNRMIYILVGILTLKGSLEL